MADGLKICCWHLPIYSNICNSVTSFNNLCFRYLPIDAAVAKRIYDESIDDYYEYYEQYEEIKDKEKLIVESERRQKLLINPTAEP